MEELVLYNVKAMHQMKNVHLLAVEHAAVLEVIIFEQFGSDNQSMIYQTLMTQLIYYIHSLILCACVSVLCVTLDIFGTARMSERLCYFYHATTTLAHAVVNLYVLTP